MADYSLPSLVTVNGTFAFAIKNADIGGLKEPTEQTITSVDAVEEILDIDVMVTQIPKLVIKIRDDYSTHAVGFWYELLVGNAELYITLDEGSGATFFFYGKLNRETINWSEHYVSATRIRMAEISFDAMDAQLLSTDLTTWIDDVPDHADATGQTSPIPSKVLTFKEFFASLVYKSGLNASFDADDVSFLIGTADFKFSKSTTEYTLDELRIATHFDAGGGDTLTDYFSSGAGDYIPKLYQTTKDFLSDLSKNLAIVFRLGYSGSRHTLTVMQRGRAFSGTVTFGSPERLRTSSITLASNIIAQLIRATRLTDDTAYAFTDSTGSILTGAVPTNIEFDLDFLNIFGAMTPSADAYTWTLYDGGNYATMAPIDEVEAWDYDNGVYQSYSTDPVMEKAVAFYYYHRYAASRRLITRTYGTLKADDGVDESHEHIHILRRTSIDDGNGAVNYFANKVKKMPALNEIEVEWIEE